MECRYCLTTFRHISVINICMPGGPKDVILSKQIDRYINVKILVSGILSDQTRSVKLNTYGPAILTRPGVYKTPPRHQKATPFCTAQLPFLLTCLAIRRNQHIHPSRCEAHVNREATSRSSELLHGIGSPSPPPFRSSEGPCLVDSNDCFPVANFARAENVFVSTY